MNTDTLFENHTIKEIQEIEKKLRNDIEKKKEELRQMVGERYRDLMDAADTITEMKDISENVTSCIKSIENNFGQLQDTSLRGGTLHKLQEKVDLRQEQNKLLYTVASLIKILMDSPEKIWSSMENKNFINAVSFFLLARHTHTLLVIDPMYQNLKIPQKFPIINGQWSSVNHLKQVLMQKSQSTLKTQDVESKDVLGALVCDCLLTNSSVTEVLIKVLEIRKNVVKQIFHPEKYARDQICEYVIVIQRTLQIVYDLFYWEDSHTFDDCEVQLLHLTLKKITSKNENGPVSLLDLDTTKMYKFLPSIVTDFRPSTKEPIESCRHDFLKSKCEEWMNDVYNNFNEDVIKLLQFVNSVKSLSSIRLAVINNLCQVDYWNKICEKLLGKLLSIWDRFLKENFYHRIRDIIRIKVENSSSLCQKNVEEILSNICNLSVNNFEFDQNISSYVWKEEPGDIMENIAWTPRYQRNLWNSGELSMKTMGYTPSIQSICKDLDQKLKDTVEDLVSFSHLEAPIREKLLKEKQISPLQKQMSLDAVATYPCLMECVGKYMHELFSFIEATLTYLKCEKDNFGNSCRLVFLGHISHAIVHLCPHINICLSSEKLIESSQAHRDHGAKSLSSFIIKECERWKELKNKFLEMNALAFQTWSEGHIYQLLNVLGSELQTGSVEGVLKMLLRWEKVEIQEESELGNAVKSVLRIPQHISLPLSSALFAFCCKLNNIGGYAISSDIRSLMSRELLLGLLNVYKKKVIAGSGSAEFNARLLQVQSLQLLFDVQFLLGLMVYKDSSTDKISLLSQEIIDTAISYVDPFDMDVFSVPLQQNFKKALQKSLSLYGLVASPDQITYINSMKAQSVSSHMEHNVTLCSAVGTRFPLLPLSSRSTTLKTLHQEELESPPQESEAKPLQSIRSSPNLSASDMQTNTMKHATSFYDRVTAMSSSWFGN